MEETRMQTIREEQGDAQAIRIEIWNYVLGLAKMAAVKCAIELGISEATENHGGPMTISELSSALRCEPSLLHRLMRFLVHHRIFKEKPSSSDSIAFAQTPISRRSMRHGENSMAASVLFQSSPAMVASWQNLSANVLANGTSAFTTAHGKDIWSYAASDATQNKLFNDAMACSTRTAVRAIIESYSEAFNGVETLIDVGGGKGTALSIMVKAFPWIKGINFDLPHVVNVAEKRHGIDYVGGDMFAGVPHADAIFLKWILHDWGDDECIQILKKCRKAIPKNKRKVIIVEAIIEEEGDKSNNLVRLTLDMVMMAHTNKGKERTFKQWDYVIRQAGFSEYNIKPIDPIRSLIEAFPWYQTSITSYLSCTSN